MSATMLDVAKKALEMIEDEWRMHTCFAVLDAADGLGYPGDPAGREWAAISNARDQEGGFRDIPQQVWRGMSGADRKAERIRRLRIWIECLRKTAKAEMMTRPYVSAMPVRDIGPFGALLA